MPQAPRENRESYEIVVRDDLRPAGDGKHCFYCSEPLHAAHKLTCVIRSGAGWYHVAIKNNETGEIRHYRNDSIWGDGDEYYWTEGNASCDCNRATFFARAEDDDELSEPCGDTRFTALFAELPDGTRIDLEQ